MGRWLVLALLLSPTPLTAGTIVINFDVDAQGNPIAAPAGFASTTALTDLFVSLGVTFSGPQPLDGGAILNTLGNFGVQPTSGDNFWAFNRGAALSNGGAPNDPATITFGFLAQSVSIQVAGGSNPDTFVMEAFDANDNLVDTAIVVTQDFAPLSVAATGGIAKVVLVQTGDPVWVYDDLTITTTAQAPDFARGDCNSDGSFNLPDVVFLLGFLFPQGGVPPALLCTDACDSNDDGSLNLPDAVTALAALFGMPSVPLPPPLVCGADPTPNDGLDCASFPACP